MSMSVDIVRLIESNPIARFNQTYQSKLIEKLQTNFSDYEQQMFLSSFYCYLKYDKVNDFVIDVDNIWEWLGFSRKYHAKYLLEKHFIIEKDYKILLPKFQQQTFGLDNMMNIEEEKEEYNPRNDILSLVGTERAEAGFGIGLGLGYMEVGLE